MKKAHEIAEYFLSLTDLDSGDSISNMKLQKLLYYAQGFHVALKDQKLFNEKIMAWTYGPVVVEVYQKYSIHGGNGIPIPEIKNYNKYTKDEREFLNEIYEIFGQYSAWKLSNMTHEEAPWKETAINDEITSDKLKNYFKDYISE